MFGAVLVANRGEIAIRVIRGCQELGVKAIAVFSEADAHAPHVRLADEAFAIGGANPADSYLNIDRIVEVAVRAGADAVHPGYGFLAENANFARALAEASCTFIGPSPEAIDSMGNKLAARAVALAAGVPVVPGTQQPVQGPDEVRAFGEQHGYPVAIKALYGGGGRGMKVVDRPGQVEDALGAAEREAIASFGRGECYLERYLERPRHIEIQVLADREGTVLQLGDRDCSLQRRHQKLIEEAPAAAIDAAVRSEMAEAALRVAREMSYVSAGTCEFLLDSDGRRFYFLEMNTRLQVEHPVTEMVTGVDLVHEQLRIAAGDGMSITQDDVRLRGHSMEVRINAEDPHNGFLPGAGLITQLSPPLGPGVRFDTGARTGYEVPPYYDSMIGKLIVWAPTRETARTRMLRALDELVISGVPTTVPFHKFALEQPQFIASTHSTMSVEHEWTLADMPPAAPDDAASQELTLSSEQVSPEASMREVQLTISGEPTYVTVYGSPGRDYRDVGVTRDLRVRGATALAQSDGPELRAPMQGTVVNHAVEDGAHVAAGSLVCVIEAMKMENHVMAHRDGVVRYSRAVGDVVEKGTPLASIV